ncbi:GvpL/GvpF family gas vesicle protein [Frankia sp. Mgl5]|uniref:GvpL/GvpF family gas vesicle protein n=1 Tax=Frankia sp. Mgl5 TaxID=2933793 RepID=UPI00200BC76E|nr:GvpL/GvpF family gas vesicle protein [Frankia sp. Mgl5]MCK9931162.1 GvpL/GvpF family gas vesicle protein [Frankia sp. Mgl5]
MTVVPEDADFGSLDELAVRLAPGVLDEAVTEAREVARGQLARLLAREITRAACERGVASATCSSPAGAGSSPAGTGRREHSEHRQAHRDGPVPACHDGPGPGSREGRSPGGVERARVLYAYGIVPASTDVSGLPGLAEGTTVCAVTHGQVSLVVSAIDPELLRDVEEDLSETGRLATLARGHDQVLRELQDLAPVLPLRFGTVLPGESEAAVILDDPDIELPRALDALRDAREWGFRIDAAGPTEPPASGVLRSTGAGESTRATPAPAPPCAAGATDAGNTARPGAGTAYLSARRDELREQERRREETARLVEWTHRELLVHARDVARRPGRPDRVFDCAYLVDRGEEEGFLDTAERLGPPLEEAGYVAAVTGPWPPYSFVHLTLGGDGGSGSDRGSGSAEAGPAEALRATATRATATRATATREGTTRVAAGATPVRFSVPTGDRPGDDPEFEPGEERG